MGFCSVNQICVWGQLRSPEPGHSEGNKAALSVQHLPGGREDVLAVGADGIDGAVMALDLINGCEVVHIPDLDEARPAGAQQHGPAGYKGQGTHPVLVSIGDLLWKVQS